MGPATSRIGAALMARAQFTFSRIVRRRLCRLSLKHREPYGIL